MKIVYPICCGIDVHKKFLVATIIKSEGIKPIYSKKRFSTFNNSLLEFKKWLHDNECYDVCMESTGKYWIPVFNILEDTCNIIIANPKWVKIVKGNKDDTKDSKWIGDLFRIGLVKASYIPNKSIRILREYTRYRSRLISCKSSEKNRFQNAFTVCNVALDSVVSDMFGVSASSITDYLITSDSFDPVHCKTLLKGRLNKKADQVVESIEGYTMTDEQKFRMSLIKDHLQYIETSIKTIDQALDTMVVPYESAIKLMTTIPGVRKQSAITIISEIGIDMSQFNNTKRLCCWAGLTPSNNESAGKKKSTKISRAGVYLKPALVQVAHAAVKDKNCPYFKIKYDRIAKRRGKKRAIIAIARMILTAIYHMFTTGETFNPTDIDQVIVPEKIKLKREQDQIRKAYKILKNAGLLEDLVTI